MVVRFMLPLAVFQEEVPGSETRSSNTNQERSKRRSLKLTRPRSMVVAKIPIDFYNAIIQSLQIQKVSTLC